MPAALVVPAVQVLAEESATVAHAMALIVNAALLEQVMVHDDHPGAADCAPRTKRTKASALAAQNSTNALAAAAVKR